jgi:CheY-like chemotaxis protein/HPt (histidine-containing phosphotransfer) domain-containing protein
LLGHSVAIAGDGAQGLEKWRGGGFDIVLSDHHMPVMDGEEMLRRLREEERADPARRRTPVLGLSADRHETMQGADAHLVKPIVAGELDRALAAWLPGPAPTVIDEARLRETVGDDASAVVATLAALRESLATDLGQLRDALRDRRLDDARRMAHRILGAARAVGAARLEGAAAGMQEAAGSRDFAAAAAAFDALERARDEVVAGIEDKMRARESPSR